MQSIFVSSTFRDMHEERDAIQQIVSPALNAEARAYGDSIQFCDLRWGVNTMDLESDEASAKVLDVCFHEIDRCRPYMIVLVGERYGWIPAADLVQKAIADRPEFSVDDLEKSVTALEIEYGALQRSAHLENVWFYFREMDGDAPEYCLPEDHRHAEKLQQLKMRIQKIAGDRIRVYHTRWTGERLSGMEQFSDMVVRDIRDAMQKQWEAFAGLNPYEREQAAQWNNAAEAAQRVDSGRPEITEAVEQLIECVNETYGEIVAIYGDGWGKTSLISCAARELRSRGDDVILLYSGQASLCNSGSDVLQYCVYVLESQLQETHFHGAAVKDWQNRFLELIRKRKARDENKAGHHPLYIFVDDVDQLSFGSSEDLFSFVKMVRDEVCYVVSCSDQFQLPAFAIPHNARDFCWASDGSTILRQILKRKGRELDPKVFSGVLRFDMRPLTMSWIVQRLMLMNAQDFRNIAEMGDGMEAISSYQEQIVKDYQGVSSNLEIAAKQFGGEAAQLCLQYLAVMRSGLREADIRQLAMRQGAAFSSLDFSRFLQFSDDLLYARPNGFIDFAHQSIRTQLHLPQSRKDQLQQQMVQYLTELDRDDPLRKRELLYLQLALRDGEGAIAELCEIASGGDADAKRYACQTMFSEFSYACHILEAAINGELRFAKSGRLDFLLFYVNEFLPYAMDYYAEIDQGLEQEFLKDAILKSTTEIAKYVESHPEADVHLLIHALEMKGRIFIEQKNYVKGISDYQRAMKLRLPFTHKEYHSTKDGQELLALADVLQKIGSGFVLYGDNQRAKSYFESAIDLLLTMPDDVMRNYLPLRQTANLHFAMAQITQDGEKAERYYRQCIDFCKKQIRTEGETIEANRTIGEAYKALADLWLWNADPAKHEKAKHDLLSAAGYYDFLVSEWGQDQDLVQYFIVRDQRAQQFYREGNAEAGSEGYEQICGRLEARCKHSRLCYGPLWLLYAQILRKLGVSCRLTGGTFSLEIESGYLHMTGIELLIKSVQIMAERAENWVIKDAMREYVEWVLEVGGEVLAGGRFFELQHYSIEYLDAVKLLMKRYGDAALGNRLLKKWKETIIAMIKLASDRDQWENIVTLCKVELFEKKALERAGNLRAAELKWPIGAEDLESIEKSVKSLFSDGGNAV